MRTLLSILFFVLCASFASAQTGPYAPTYVKLLILPAAGDPGVPPVNTVVATPISATSANCNLIATTPPTSSVNPTQVVMDDPFHTGRVCAVPIPTLPPATGYRAVIITGYTLQPGETCTLSGSMVSPCESGRVVGTPPFDVTAPRNPPLPATGVGPRP